MRAGSVLLAGVVLAACEPFGTAPREFTVSLQSDRATAAVGDSILFEVRAQGPSLIEIEIDWADGNTVQIPADGAQTARSLQRHAYSQAGSYQVNAVAADLVEGSKTAGLAVRVQ
jgi:hypothetical protein